jgi:cell division protein FtsQ
VADNKNKPLTEQSDFLDEYLRRANESESSELEANDHDYQTDNNREAMLTNEKFNVDATSDFETEEIPLDSRKSKKSKDLELNENNVSQEPLKKEKKQKKEANSKTSDAGTASENEVEPVKRKRGWYTIFAAAIILFGISIGYYRYKHATMKNILVEGNYYTSEESIISKANIPANVSPDSVDLTVVIKRIESLPFVKQAEVILMPPSQVKIFITERIPVGLLLDGTKKALVDQDGIILPQLYEKTPNVPLVYGFPIKKVNDTLKTAQFEEMSHFLAALHINSLGNSTISEVAWSKEDGVVAMSTENGIKLIFGKSKPENGLKNWEAFYAQIAPKVGLASLAEVDLRWQGQVITR